MNSLAMLPRYQTSLLWLRRDLRLDDHAALYHALTASRAVQAVFVFDPAILDLLPRNDRRVVFIWQSLATLKARLNTAGADLLIRHGMPEQEIPALARQLGADAVFCNRDYEPAAIKRDAGVARQLRQQGIDFHDDKDQVIFERDEILTSTGKPYTVFTPYKNAWLKALTPDHLLACPVQTVLANLLPRAAEPMPSLDDIGFGASDPASLPLPAGSGGAETLFNEFALRIDQYHQTRDFPAENGGSGLSVHLRFGTISVRKLAAFAWLKGGHGANTWLNELIWREFYQQILWHRPDVTTHAFKQGHDKLPFPNQAHWFAAWCEGRTGYPLVDAAMRQLNTTGLMHNRLRMVTASFLVKDLLIDWRWGERYFAEKLLDFDLASNNGGWQWAASTGCDAQPFFRIFNPVSQSQRFDANGAFIRHYLPELAGLSSNTIHAPWLASPTQLVAARLRLGQDYPLPIVDHAVQRLQAIALYKDNKVG